MQYGFTLFCDELAQFKTDQISLVDRVIENFEDCSQMRSRSVFSQNTNTMLQYIRSSYPNIAEWCKPFLLKEKPIYAYILCGVTELKTGGSFYWSDRHLECLVIELLSFGYDVILVTTNIRDLNKSQIAWQSHYKESCKKIATKHGCDTLYIGGLKSHNFKSKEIERISQGIAKDLKDRYLDFENTSDLPNVAPIAPIAQKEPKKEERKKEELQHKKIDKNVIDRSQLQVLAKDKTIQEPKKEEPPKEQTTRKPIRKLLSNVKIERF